MYRPLLDRNTRATRWLKERLRTMDAVRLGQRITDRAGRAGPVHAGPGHQRGVQLNVHFTVNAANAFDGGHTLDGQQGLGQIIVYKP